MNAHCSDLVQVIHWINANGWSPATSTNYSMRHPENPELCYVSRSGVDKSTFKESDFILMDLQGHQVDQEHLQKASAETALHLTLLQRSDCSVVLHTHSLADTLLSRKHGAHGHIELAGYELLKGLRNIDTHDTRVQVPILPNTQDIESMSEDLKQLLADASLNSGFLIESHGFYTWGRSLAEAKRHLEVFQFLFQCEWDMQRVIR